MKLEDICSFRNGRNHKSLCHGNYLLVGSTGIIGHVDKYTYNQQICVIGRVGANCGYVQYIKDKCWVTDNAIIATTKCGIDAKYLYYLLCSLKINNYRIGSTQPLITSEILKSLNIPSYDSLEQKHIVDIISFVLKCR